MILRNLLQTSRRRVASSRAWNPTPMLRASSTLSSSTSWNQQHQHQHAYLPWASSAAAVALAAGALASRDEQERKAKCCGIAGVVGSGNFDARPFLIDGLTILKNRGFDSAGIATMQATGGPMAVTKFASEGDTSNSIDLIKKHHVVDGHAVGIAHTRWATHGAKSDENAHPHLDSSGKIALVHNGTLTNASGLRRELQGLGHTFISQTDSEVIAKLIGHYYSKKPNGTVKEATEKALARCDGTWGLCVMCSDAPEELVVACNGSPMVLGIGDDNRTYVASETEAFANHTKTFIRMNDGEIAVLHADGNTLDLSRTEEAEWQDEDFSMTPDPYPYWTLKEINEQPEAAARALAFGGRMGFDKVHLGGLDDQQERLKKIKHLLIAACGTSLHAARYGELLMKHLGSLDSVVTMDATETEEKDFPCPDQFDQTGLLVASQSGETKDLVNVVNAAMDSGVTVMSVINSVGSTIARMTKLGVYCNAGRENAVASTKAFTNQVAVLALIALWFRQQQGTPEQPEATRLKEALMRLPLSFGAALKTHAQCKDIAEKLKNKEHCFVLGKGFGEPVAMEGALKIKEFCYMHAEGYSGGALKHGPFALIEGDDSGGKFGATPVIMLIFDDHHAHHMRTAAEEVKARGAHVVIVTDKADLADGLDENPIVIPSNGPLTALGAVLPLQLLAYELAMQRGINPDTPRNLAKAVLVD